MTKEEEERRAAWAADISIAIKYFAREMWPRKERHPPAGEWKLSKW